MVEWVKVKSIDPLKAFEKSVEQEAQTAIISPKKKLSSSTATASRTPSSSILTKERLAKLLSELAISERQKRELQISLEQENERRTAMEKSTQELTGNLTGKEVRLFQYKVITQIFKELRIKYEKSVSYLKIVKRWIEKQKKRKESQDETDTKNNTVIWESRIVPVIQVRYHINMKQL